MKDMELITRQEPGLVEFYNFEDLKEFLEVETQDEEYEQNQD